MKKNTIFPFISILGFILSVFLLGLTYFLQVYKGVNPCPLCLLQRLDIALLGIIFFMGAVIHFKKIGRLLLGILGLLIGISGLLLSGRQVWLQVSPSSSSGNCSASLSYIFNALSLPEAIKQIWQGGMECSQTGWEFLHLSLASWSLMSFGILCLFFILQLTHATTD